MKKILFLATFSISLTLSSQSFSKTEDIGENFHFEEIKNKQRTIASEAKVARPDVEAVEASFEHDEDNERSVASDQEKEPDHQGVKFWKFTP